MRVLGGSEALFPYHRSPTGLRSKSTLIPDFLASLRTLILQNRIKVRIANIYI